MLITLARPLTSLKAQESVYWFREGRLSRLYASHGDHHLIRDCHFFPPHLSVLSQIVARLGLASTTVDDCRLELQFDLSGAAASGLELLDNLHTGVICDFAENDVFAIEPGSDDRSDEELRAVPAKYICQC